MNLYVVRHGETQFNIEKRYAGQTDVPLNETGIEQAKELAKKLEGEPFDVIVTSSLLRAKMTAEQIAEYNCTRQLDDAPTGGETTRQVDSRVAKGLEILKEKYPEKKVLLVCHGFVSRAINRQMRGLSFEEMHGFSLGNCEVVQYEM